ncbi:hypothetical protein MKW98_011220 [Papaver atlanticum]|uniref:RNA helicase aquarius N-terminal domain-containing protein n=1 Tax=Papaver atlanticum TaxID=357466 RepID=A0AAD4XJ97_9MAGN|nr:hypothetical protein MKW98_011220 [Papaver atlanticum]
MEEEELNLLLRFGVEEWGLVFGGIAGKTYYLLFLINVFQSLEDDIVSQTALKLASLRVWSCLSYGRLQLEVRFVKNPIEEILEILDSQVFSHRQPDRGDSQLGGSEQVDNGCVLYRERFMEFLIDLLSQLPTRRFLRPIVADVAVVTYSFY